MSAVLLRLCRTACNFLQNGDARFSIFACNFWEFALAKNTQTEAQPTAPEITVRPLKMPEWSAAWAVKATAGTMLQWNVSGAKWSPSGWIVNTRPSRKLQLMFMNTAGVSTHSNGYMHHWTIWHQPPTTIPGLFSRDIQWFRLYQMGYSSTSHVFYINLFFHRYHHFYLFIRAFFCNQFNCTAIKQIGKLNSFLSKWIYNSSTHTVISFMSSHHTSTEPFSLMPTTNLRPIYL